MSDPSSSRSSSVPSPVLAPSQHRYNLGASSQDKETAPDSAPATTDDPFATVAPVRVPPDELTGFLAPAQQPDELGRLGGYRILKVLGAGGMGVVFQAEDLQLQRPVALKAMLPALAASGSARLRFLREARAAAALKHDHVVTIYQVGEDRGVPFLTMELLDGVSLDGWLKNGNRPTLTQVLRIGREMAEGLAAAHARGLIHRDIKPANLWLERPRDRLKILDFGLARAVEDTGAVGHLTQSGAILGTPAYMAPEQTLGEKVDARCDLFSLGCVLYQLCTARLPFQGKDPLSLLLAIRSETPRPVQELNPQLPRALAELIMQLLARDRERRPASARAVADALRAVEEQTPVRSSPLVAEDRTLREAPAGERPSGQPLRRGRRWLVGAAVAAGLLALLVVMAFRLRSSGGPGPDAAGVKENLVQENQVKENQGGHRQDDRRQDSAATRANRGDDGQQDLVVTLGRLPSGFKTNALAVAPDNRFVAVGGSSDSVLLWDLGTGQKLPGLEDHPNGVFALAFSPDGKTLAVGCFKHIKLWDTGSWQETKTLKGHEDNVYGLAFSPDGKFLASTSRGGGRVWDLSQAEVRWPGPDQAPDFSPDGKRLLWWNPDSSTAPFWDMTVEPKENPDRGYFSAESFITPSNRLVYVPGYAIPVVTFSPDGQFLALGSGRLPIQGFATKVWLWDPRTAKHLGTLDGHTAPIVGLSFSPDSTTLASSSEDRTIILWDVASRKEQVTLKGPKGARLHWGYFYQGPGNWLLSHDEKDPHLLLRWGKTGKEVARLPIDQTEIDREAWSKDATLLTVITKEALVKSYRMDKIIKAAAR